MSGCYTQREESKVSMKVSIVRVCLCSAYVCACICLCSAYVRVRDVFVVCTYACLCGVFNKLVYMCGVFEVSVGVWCFLR